MTTKPPRQPPRQPPQLLPKSLRRPSAISQGQLTDRLQSPPAMLSRLCYGLAVWRNPGSLTRPQSQSGGGSSTQPSSTGGVLLSASAQQMPSMCWLRLRLRLRLQRRQRLRLRR